MNFLKKMFDNNTRYYEHENTLCLKGCYIKSIIFDGETYYYIENMYGKVLSYRRPTGYNYYQWVEMNKTWPIHSMMTWDSIDRVKLFIKNINDNYGKLYSIHVIEKI